jgi:transketolase
LARSLRLDILEMINHAGFGHIGGSFSSVDILISLYNSGIFNFEKDHFILSAGHICPALYAVLAYEGKFPREELLTYAQFAHLDEYQVHKPRCVSSFPKLL